VAVLLATYNGSQFVSEQIRSLTRNASPFTIHWIDDHSTDNTCSMVNRAVRDTGVDLREWGHPDRQGYPKTFFDLLERVEAEFYLFCDQDDIWQAGKIDATVRALQTDRLSPALSFSDPLIFNNDRPYEVRSLFDILELDPGQIIEPTRSFTFVPAVGNTVGITRPLRNLYLRHKVIARSHAFAHDWWMYILALSLGKVQFLANSPTTLWRQHQSNFSAAFFRKRRRGVGHFPMNWRLQPLLRGLYSRQAQGFLLAAETFPQSAELQRLVAAARMVAALEKRQSPVEIAHLLRCKVTPPRLGATFRLAMSCLLGNVPPNMQLVAQRRERISAVGTQESSSADS
jgi:rhamnosyltransferase